MGRGSELCSQPPMGENVRKLFGPDGIRGVANQDPMTAEVALRLGQAVAQRFRHPSRPGRIVIGKDTRLSGYMLESALVAGIVTAGARGPNGGPPPPPGPAVLTPPSGAPPGGLPHAPHTPPPAN